MLKNGPKSMGKENLLLIPCVRTERLPEQRAMKGLAWATLFLFAIESVVHRSPASASPGRFFRSAYFFRWFACTLKLEMCIVYYQFSSVAQSCLTLCDLWTEAHQASLSITNSWSPPKPMSIELVMPSNNLILCHPLLLLPSIFPSIRVFYNESALCIRWPKYWSFSFNISPSNEQPELISFRMDWLDLLVVQETLKSLLQYHSSKASILPCSAFFIVQLSHPYMTTGKTIALTKWTFVGKVMSLLFNMLFRLVIMFLPRSKHLLISWLQSPSAVILEPKNWNRGRWFSGIPMHSLWSSECWQFDLWFLCLF